MAPKAWDHRVVNPLNPYENFDSENDDDQLQAIAQDKTGGGINQFQVFE